MKILALLTPTEGKTPLDFRPHLLAEEKVVWTLYTAGTLREMYFQDHPIAVSLIFEAPSQEAVQAELQNFPMIKAGLLNIALTTLGPWIPLQILFDPAHHEG